MGKGRGRITRLTLGRFRRAGRAGGDGWGGDGSGRRGAARGGAVEAPRVAVRALVYDDVPAAESLLDAAVAGRRQRRLGEEHDVLGFPGFGAWAADELIGLATWTAGRPRAEVAVLAVAAGHRGHGIGGVLLEWVAAAGRKHGTHDLWLVTTNDNLDALRLYQRHAFRLVELHAGAVDAAREHKPQIPRDGEYGIPLHDELVLQRHL
jgi:ribosomal protein S18 acetylase RimI-like enzyme